MRCLLLTLPLALVWTATARPDEVADLRDRVLRAAAKDPKDLKKFRMFTLTAQGTSLLGPEPVTGTFRMVAVYPGQLKLSWQFGSGDNQSMVTVCADNDRGWRKDTGLLTTDLPPEDLNDLRTGIYGVFASTLLTLTEPETKLSLGGRSKVNGDPVVGLKLSRRPYPDVTLYFDEKTHLLRKMSYRARENGVVALKETLFGDHKQVTGLVLPTTQTTYTRGREEYSLKDMRYEFPDKLDGKTFDRP